MLKDFLDKRIRRKTNSGFFMPEIDGLRFLAILMVVCIHVYGFVLVKYPYPGELGYPIFRGFFENGFKGVELFFVISGFILALPFAKHLLKGGAKVDIRKFYLRRLTRLEPPYMIALFATFFLLIIKHKYDFAGLFPGLLASVFYLHNFFDTLPWVNGVTWSLEIEMQFYLLAPFIAAVFGLSPKRRRALLAGLIFLLPAIQAFFPTDHRSLYNFLQYFLVGYLLVDFYLSGLTKTWSKSLNGLAGVCLLILIIYLPISDKFIGVRAGEPLYYQFIYLAAIFLFYLLVLSEGLWKKIFSNSLVAAIGGMCYTIYLWHELVISAVGNKSIHIFTGGGGALPVVVMVQLLIILPATVLVSLFFYVTIERPCMDQMWVKNLIMFLFKLANRLFSIQWLYKPLYFMYKRFSDRDKIAFLRDKINPGMTVVDIGANIGFYTILLSKLVGKTGKVYAFEPEKRNFDLLKKYAAGLDNVVLIDKAVGEKTGKIKLYKSKDLNVDHQTYDIGEGRTIEEIDCVAIDDFLADQPKVDFIKIDIQGYDFFAIKGMAKILAGNSLSIIGEFWPYGLEKAGVAPEEYLDFLKSLGYRLTEFGSDKDFTYEIKGDPKLYYLDYLAIK
ncbi:FkbM family methyltransferase [Candidatus Falkowbacteria bacterium]|nr:FkbM family methyltransferase [Candidatus Falkowbacteria bacterium]